MSPVRMKSFGENFDDWSKFKSQSYLRLKSRGNLLSIPSPAINTPLSPVKSTQSNLNESIQTGVSRRQGIFYKDLDSPLKANQQINYDVAIGQLDTANFTSKVLKKRLERVSKSVDLKTKICSIQEQIEELDKSLNIVKNDTTQLKFGKEDSLKSGFFPLKAKKKNSKKNNLVVTDEDRFIRKENTLKEMSTLVIKCKNRNRSDLLQSRDVDVLDRPKEVVFLRTCGDQDSRNSKLQNRSRIHQNSIDFSKFANQFRSQVKISSSESSVKSHTSEDVDKVDLTTKF